MPAIARVLADVAADREFDYAIPAHLLTDVRIGSRVRVPFGRREAMGYVVGLTDRSERPDLKEIAGVEGGRPFVDERMLELVRWMAAYYCAPIEQALRTVLPGAVRRTGNRFREQLTVALAPPPDAAAPSAAALPRVTPRQQAVLDLLTAEGSLPLQVVLARLGGSPAPVQALARHGRVTLAPAVVRRDPLANRRILRSGPLPLMPEQAAALVTIRQAIDTLTPRVILLHGVTGSGKTEVYLQALAHALQAGKGAIVLVPEIALTPQTIERFLARFGPRIAVLHSHLSEGERHDEWHRIADGQADIVIGARSAVFAPVANLGLIVVDEEHEPSYKQEEAPRYHARDVAVMRGHRQGCAVVLGSATPALESWHNAQRGKYALAVLPRRADDRQMPVLRIVDMRIEAARTGHISVFSRDLLEAIRARLDRAEQTILFLNRRGFATSLLCPKCGFVSSCSQCSVAHTYHRAAERLCCHICGGSLPVPARCPQCADPQFRYAGFGTQRVEGIVRRCFPKAAVERMDADTTTRRAAYEEIFGAFRTGKVDILIGTQMIAKGLHFPNVTLVGVVNADLSLHMPDFRAGERTFQLLSQVAGRAGRGDVSGEVIVQTYTPCDPAIQAARRQDYEGYCDQELEGRRELSYPPFSHLVCVTASAEEEQAVADWLAAFAQAVRSRTESRVSVSETTPAPLARAKGFYRYQMLMRCPSVAAMTGPLREALRTHKPPAKVSVAVDVDAVNLL